MSEEPKDVYKKPLILRIQDSLNDTDFLRNIRTIIIFIVAVGFPILYFGFFDNIMLDMLFNWDIGVLAILSTFLLGLVKSDTKSRAFEDEIVTNEKLNEVEQNIYIENGKVKNHLLGNKFVIKYNTDEQELADELETEKRKNELSIIKTKFEIKGKTKSKKYSKIINELNGLENKKIHGKYKPIVYDELYSLENKKKDKSSHARENLRYDPKKENWFSTVSGIVLKGTTIGGVGSIPFLWNKDGKTILLFYLTFIFSILLTVLTTYIKIRVKTGKKYLAARKFKLSLMYRLNCFIEENEKTIIKDEVPKESEAANNVKPIEIPESDTGRSDQSIETGKIVNEQSIV